MAGIFKSLEKSDIRLTPFRTYKQWFDGIGYTFYTSSAVVTAPVYRLLSSWGSTYYGNDIIYAETTDGITHRIDTTDHFTELSTITASFLFTQAGPTANWLLHYSGSALHVRDNTMATLSSSVKANLTVNAIDQNTASFSAPSASIIVATNYSASISNGLLKFNLTPQGSMSYAGDWTTPQYSGSYKALICNTNTKKIFAIYTPSGSTDLQIIAQDLTTAGTTMIGPQSFGTSGTVKRFLLDSGSTAEGALAGNLWTLLTDGRLYGTTGLSFYNLGLATTDIFDIVIDNDAYIAPTNQHPLQKVHALTTSGLLLTNIKWNATEALASRPALQYDEIIDCRKMIGLNKQICSMTINKNIDTLQSGSSSIITVVAGTTSSLTENIVFTVNPTTGDFGDPIHLGSTKGTILTLCDNLIDTVATDSGSSINVDKGGYIRNWYVFDI